MKELGLPSFISKINNKPILLNSGGRCLTVIPSTTTKSRSKEKTGDPFFSKLYTELVVDVFLFKYISKYGLQILRPKFKYSQLELAFTIEGRSDEELPEVLLGIGRLNYVDAMNAPFAKVRLKI